MHEPPTKPTIKPSNEGPSHVPWEFLNAQLFPCWLGLWSLKYFRVWQQWALFRSNSCVTRLPRCRRMSAPAGRHLDCTGGALRPPRWDIRTQGGFLGHLSAYDLKTLLPSQLPFTGYRKLPRWVSPIISEIGEKILFQILKIEDEKPRVCWRNLRGL